VLFLAGLLVAVRVAGSDLDDVGQAIESDARLARYYVAHDDTPGGRVVASAGREGTRFSGQGFDDWGAYLVLARAFLTVEEPCAPSVAHVHAAAGDDDTEVAVAFDARRAAASQAEELVVAVADAYVLPEDGICTSCWDRFTVRVPLTTEWQSFVVPLRRFRQEGWGEPARDEADPATLGYVALGVDPHVQFDVVLRDLRVVRVPHVADDADEGQDEGGDEWPRSDESDHEEESEGDGE
jgi:hypothetical protein